MAGIYERGYQGKTNEWLTPPEIICALGEFDLDPCSPEIRPWPTAKKHFTKTDDGLSRPWRGRVWVNPPYGPHAKQWLKKLAAHGNGVALVFARTETAMFFEHVWPLASAVLFIKGRLRFHRPDGTRAGASGAPACLIAYGEENVLAIERSGIEGKLVVLEPAACGLS